MSSKINTKGRVIETWVDQDTGYVEMIRNSATQPRCLFSTSNIHLLEQIKRGDWVHILSEDNKILDLQKLSSSYRHPWSPHADSMRWTKAVQGPTRMQRLFQRQEILREIRKDLYHQQFIEIETPLLVKGTCPDTHIESMTADGGYLVTSTEYQIKRLIVGGFENVFTLTKNFRANDRGRFHSTEFTMLEWARSFGTLHEIEEDAIRFIRSAFQKIHINQSSLRYQDLEIDFMNADWERLTVRGAFEKYLGLRHLGDFSLEHLLAAARAANVSVPTHFQEDQHLVLSYLLDLVQPHLGKKTPTFLQEWPAFMTSSARLSEKDPHAAERSELYIAGIEIADGFPFLCDPNSQRIFFEREIQRRESEGKRPVRVDEKYVDALEEGIPPGAGMALGVDRLVMVLTGASQLSDVQAFSWEEI